MLSYTYKIKLFISFLLITALGAHAQNKRPNIIYVLADEYRAQATGYAGDPNVKTPNLDRLAANSVNFSNAVSVLPVCTPHRAALLTGRYPESTGMFLNDLYLPAQELTMAEIFKDAGYNTAYIGKWHVDGHGRTSYIPAERRQGFTYWKANECTHNYNHSVYYYNNDTTARYWPGYDVYAETRDAQNYIKNNSKNSKPFILVVGYGAPHFPHKTAPKNLKKLYNATKLVMPPNVSADMIAPAQEEAVGYYAHCTAIDSCIGELRKTIQESEIDNNTIFIFTADHGEMLGSHGVHPAAKQRPWDEAIKVPFLLHYPALGHNSVKNIKWPINTPDILPTLLGLCHINKPNTIEGDDLADAIKGAKMITDRAALVMNLAPFAEDFGGDEFRGIRTSQYTYVRNLKGPWLMFDDINDPFQMHNLVNEKAYATLQAQLDKTLQQKLNDREDTFQPKEYYLKKWGYTVSAKKGEIPYGAGPHDAQSPKPQIKR